MAGDKSPYWAFPLPFNISSLSFRLSEANGEI